jgi:hypothetical protein
VGCERLRECWWGNPRETRISGWPLGLARRMLSLQRDLSLPHRPRWEWGFCHTWRHTASKRPCTTTSSAGSTIGA